MVLLAILLVGLFVMILAEVHVQKRAKLVVASKEALERVEKHAQIIVTILVQEHLVLEIAQLCAIHNVLQIVEIIVELRVVLIVKTIAVALALLLVAMVQLVAKFVIILA